MKGYIVGKMIFIFFYIHTKILLEFFSEVIFIVKSYGRCDFTGGETGGFNKLFCFYHSVGKKIFRYGFSRTFFIHGGKISV